MYHGGLAAHFIMQVRSKISQPAPKDTNQLRETDCSPWSSGPLFCSEPKDVRDQKEVQLLTKLLLEMGHSRFGEAADRIREFRMAKKDGGTWDKASPLSLLSSRHTGSTVLPDGGFGL